ncbi:MAG: BamA/TamA family outer membrane protein [Deltaproteobacteria bacterium]|nr:BamA/TamA family outer membrane protein [Deltaproteobacteria bacterium]
MTCILSTPLVSWGQGLGDLEGRRIGIVRYEPDQWQRDAARDSGLEPGAALTSPAVRAALRKLWRSRRYSDIRVLVDELPSGSLVVTFETRPVLRIDEVRVRGNRALSRDEVARALGFGPDREVTPEDLPTIEAAAERAYAERGYGAARATASIVPSDEEGRVGLSVEIEEGPPVRLGAVRYEGELALARELVRETVGAERGSIFDQVRLRQGLMRVRELYRSRGYYNAQIEDPLPFELPGGGRIGLTIRIRANNRFVVRFEGALRARSSDLVAALDLGSEREISEGVLATLSERIRDYYRVRGYRHAEIRPRLEPDDRARVTTITFRVVEGPQVRVRHLLFEGNAHFDDGFLREQVYSFLEEELPASFFFQAIDRDALDTLGLSGRPGASRSRIDPPPPLRFSPREVFDEKTYGHAIEHLVELYKVDGYLDVEIGQPVLQESPGVPTVRVRIREGPRTLISEVRYRGNRVLTSADLAEATELVAGEPLSVTTSEQALARLEEAYASQGFLYARIEQRVEKSEDGRRARITFTIEERARARIARILIRGNDRTSPALIRQRLTFSVGDWFTSDDAERSRERLLALGIFRTASIEPLDPAVEEADKAVVVTLRERMPNYVDLRGGGSTGEGVRFGIEYGYRNLFGWGLTFSIRSDFSYQVFFYDPDFEREFNDLPLGDQLERRVIGGLTLPSTPGLGFLGTSFQVAHQRQNELTFGYTTTGALLSATTATLRPFTPRLELGVASTDQAVFNREALDDYLATHDDLRLRRLLRVPEGESAFETIGASLSLDLRDNPFTPARGLFASVTSEYVQSLTQEKFPSQLVKATTLLSGYVPLGSSSVVLAVSGRLGRIYHLAKVSEAYQDRRFFLGGVDTIRGFPEESMVSQNVADEAKRQAEQSPNAEPLPVFPGGEAFVTLRGELRFPIFGPLAGGLFLDAGNLWTRSAGDRDATFDPFELRTAVGAGFRLVTPVGAVALDYGLNLQPRRFGALDEPTGALHFSIGLF